MKYATYKEKILLHRHKNKKSALRFLRSPICLRESDKYRVYVLNKLGQKIREIDEGGLEVGEGGLGFEGE